jgi:hypothetical protein
MTINYVAGRSVVRGSVSNIINSGDYLNYISSASAINAVFSRHRIIMGRWFNSLSTLKRGTFSVIQLKVHHIQMNRMRYFVNENE